MREKLQRFLMGRYGNDKLNTLLCVLSWISFIFGIVGATFLNGMAGRLIGGVFYLIAISCIAMALFRMLSRKIVNRQAELEWYNAKIRWPIKRLFRKAKARSEQKKTHRLFKCPGCRCTVRVPKGKGKIRITCPKCGKVFEKKS